MENSTKRRSRMRRQATGRRIELTQRDLDIFRLLSRYRFLRSTFIHAFVGGNKTKLIERLGHLYHEGGYLNRPLQQWQAINARYQPAIYELDAKGDDVLGLCDMSTDTTTRLRQGQPGAHRQFAHSLMICDVLASIELGTREHGAPRFITWQEILRHPRCPKRTRMAANPFEIGASTGANTTAGFQNSYHRTKVIPDALFGIEYQSGDRKTYRFFALEADRNTMPVTRSAARQTSYLRKLLAYREIISLQLYRTHFGLPNLFLLNVTINAEHMQGMMSALNKIGADEQFFLFKTMPSLASVEKAPCPTPHMLTEPWQRVGLECFQIDRP